MQQKYRLFIIGSISDSILINVKVILFIMSSIFNNLIYKIWAKLSAFYCRQHFRQQVICC